MMVHRGLAGEKIEQHALGIQVPPQQVLGPSKPTPNTFSEGTWILRDEIKCFDMF